MPQRTFLSRPGCVSCAAYFSFEIFGSPNSLSTARVESTCHDIFDRLELGAPIQIGNPLKSKLNCRDFVTMRQNDSGGVFFYPGGELWRVVVAKSVHQLTDEEAKALAEELWKLLLEFGAVALFAGEEALCPTEEMFMNALSKDSWREASALLYIYTANGKTERHFLL